MAEAPEPPPELLYIWQWYCEMRNAELLTHAEIKAWADLSGNRPEPREVEMLRMLDAIRWKVAHE